MSIVPEHVQACMMELFRDFPFTTDFIDDIHIFSDSYEEHVIHVTQAINKLTNANLKLNIKKCVFNQEKIKVLRFIVSKDGIECDNEKIQEVLKWSNPRNGKAVQRFLGLVNYLRDHVRSMSELTV